MGCPKQCGSEENQRPLNTLLNYHNV